VRRAGSTFLPIRSVSAQKSSRRTTGIKPDYDERPPDCTIEAYPNETERVTAVASDVLEANVPVRLVRLIGVRVAAFEGVAPDRPAPPRGADGQFTRPVEEDGGAVGSATLSG
jgi:hypothetical protein